jgi:hypothetical protein
VAYEIVDYVEGVYEVALQLQPAGRIHGSIVSEKGGLPPLSGVTIKAPLFHDDVEINPLSPDQGDVAEDATFEIEGMFGQRQLQVMGLDPGWTVVAIRQGRSDVAPRGIDVPLDATVEVSIVIGRR